MTGPKFSLNEINASTGNSQQGGSSFTTIGDAFNSISSSLSNLSDSAIRYVDSATKTLIKLGGTDGTKITNLSDGELSSSSSDAVNGSQLYTTNQNVKKNATDIATNTTDIAINTTDIANLGSSLASGKTGILQVSEDGKELVIADTAKNAASFNIGDRVMAGVKAGALGEGSLEAVNGSQLYTTNQNVKKNATDIATNTTGIAINTTDIANLGSSLASGKTGILQVSEDGKELVIADTAKNAASFNIGDRVMAGVKAGALGEGSLEAVNGSQLYTTNQNVKKNATDIATNTTGIAINTTDIANLGSSLASGKTGILQVSEDGKELVIADTAKNAASFNIGDRVMAGVKAGALGEGSLEAVNGSQLYTTNQNVKKNATDIATNTTGIAINTTDIANLGSSLASGKTGILQVSEDGKELVIADTAKNAASFNIGDRVMAGVKAGALGEGSLEAVNGSQLYTTNQNVKKNATDIATNTTGIAINTTDIANLGSSLASGKTGILQVSEDGKELVIADTAKNAASFNIGDRVMAGVKAGALGEGSLEAVNGSQLYTTNQNVKKNATDIATNTTGIAINTTDIANLGSSLASGKTGILQVSEDGKELVIADTAKNAASFNIGDRVMAGVKAGALGEGSLEAVNGSQLYTTNQNVKKNATDIATNTTGIAINTTDIANLGSSLASGKTGILQVSEDGKELMFSNIASGARMLNMGNRTITGVSAGAINATSTEAVNGTQLYTTNTKVEQNSNDIHALSNDMASGKAGLIQIDESNNSLVINDSGKNIGKFDMGDRTVSGVKAGELSQSSTEAVNGSQLYETNQQVSHNTTAISQLSNDISSGKAGIVQVEGNKIVLNDKGKATTTIDAGGRDITNVKKGEITKTSNAAVNGSQLFETNVKVDNNTKNINKNTNDISKNKSDIATHSNQIANLKSSFTGMNKAFADLTKEVDRNKKRAEAGIAGAMAMTAIPYVTSQDYSFGMAMSGYQQQGAVAAGMSFRTSDNSAVRVNTSWDSQHGTGIAAGFAVGW